MINLKVSKIFYQISEYYAMDDVAFKPQAYERAARLIEAMDDDLADIYKEGGVKALMEIPGVGRGMAEKIEEYVKVGKIKEYEKLKKACPVDLEHLTAVEGLGPKSIKMLYQKLHIKTLADLEKAAKTGKIEKLPRFGPKVQENILRGIEFVKGGQGRMLLGFALPLVRKMEKRLAELKEVEKVVVAGSVRRMKETIGDIDILAISGKPQKVMDYFCSMAEVEKVLSKGETRSSVRLHNGLEADLRVVPQKSFGSALQYFTGNKDHNIKTRHLAQGKNLKLNEYGIWRGKKQIVGRSEEEVYRALGLPYFEPEIRENTGEIEAALEDKLPKLVKYQEIKGDLQMHTTWSDGAYSIKEMAEEAKKLDYEYIAVTDHAGRLRVANSLNKKEILAQWREIDKLNKSLKSIKILKGVEVDLDENGRPELAEELLAKFDLVLGAVHSRFRQPKKEATQRLINAIKNPHIDILAHPTGRKIQGREEIALDIKEIFRVAKETNTILEINAYPERLDLNDINIRKAVEGNIKLSLGTDAHSLNHLSYMELGIAQARRGWAEKKDIINCLSFGDLKKFLK
jgi:DNA polymerase (family 10)